jgi:two-component system sensor histidine kinase KdpD
MRSGARVFGYAAAVLGVAATTAAIHLLPGAERIANISMLYLLVVIATAVGFGSGPAVAASVLAFLAFNWLFVEPRHTWLVADPAEWIALLSFLATAVVTGQLTALLRSRAEEARRRELEATALAAAGLAVAAQVDRDRALTEVLRRLADVTGLESALIRVFRPDGAAETAAAFGSGLDPDSPGPDDQRLPLMVERRELGELRYRLPPGGRLGEGERRVAASLAGHAAMVIERDRLAQAELRARALAEADRLKTALLSMVSHDFRSPLTAIKASVTGLLQEEVSPDAETRRELLQGIDRETDRLSGMVGNILALSRLEADAWRPQREPTAVLELVGAALDTFSEEENRRIHVSADPQLTEVDLDPVQMVQVLRNLLDNARKYSPAGSPIELRAAREADTLLLEVMDRGFGLPEGDPERVFEPFYRAPHLRESSIPGVGIGLAVCRGLVEAHLGRLSAYPRPGGGSVFRISIPLQAP